MVFVSVRRLLVLIVSLVGSAVVAYHWSVPWGLLLLLAIQAIAVSTVRSTRRRDLENDGFSMAGPGEDALPVRFVRGLIMNMITQRLVTVELSEGHPFAEWSARLGFDDVDYPRVVNRLKVMTDTINPYPYAKDMSGWFEIRTGGRTYRFDLLVAAQDRSITLSLRHDAAVASGEGSAATH